MTKIKVISGLCVLMLVACGSQVSPSTIHVNDQVQSVASTGDQLLEHNASSSRFMYDYLP